MGAGLVTQLSVLIPRMLSSTLVLHIGGSSRSLCYLSRSVWMMWHSLSGEYLVLGAIHGALYFQTVLKWLLGTVSLQNVLLDMDGRAKIVDFGISRVKVWHLYPHAFEPCIELHQTACLWRFPYACFNRVLNCLKRIGDTSCWGLWRIEVG